MPDIIVVTEHNMTNIELERLNLENYHLVSHYARLTTTGGGVLILSRQSLMGRRVVSTPITDLCSDKVFECCVAKYKLDKFSFILAGIYRKPNFENNEFIDRLNSLIEILITKEKNVIIIGDINVDFLKESNICVNLKNVLTCHGLKYLINFPTRVSPTSATCIDNVFTNLSKNEVKVTGVVTNLSDHDGQILEILKQPTPIKNNNLTFSKRKFSSENVTLFKSLLGKENWLEMFNAPVDEKFNSFNTIFHYYFDLCFPIVTVTKRPSKNNWISEELKEKRKEVINFRVLDKNFRPQNYKDLLKLKSKEFKVDLIREKKQYFDNKIKNSENMSKSMWEVINSQTENVNSQRLHQENISLKFSESVVTDPKKISNSFNTYFVNMVDDLLLEVPSRKCNDINTCNVEAHQFQCPPVQEDELEKILNSLKNKWSSGYDDVPIKVIKDVKTALIKPLLHLINSSLISGIFPDKLKISKVVPVHKKGETTDIQNYRPISILPAFSKIFEKAMFNRLAEFLEKNNLLNSQQHGFRKNKSTVTALVDFTESVIDSIDKREKITGIFMDLSKAFDSISHSKLLNKLQNFGVNKTAFQWLESYLSDRFQYVEVTHIKNNKLTKHHSQKQKVKRGVPQGSILGPLLFICYINDMPNCLNCSTKSELCLYADDSNLLTSSVNYNDLEVNACIELANIEEYLIGNSLILNTQKTNYITFTTRQNQTNSQINLFVGDDHINQVDQTKFLGLFIDKHLSWDNHVKYVARRISSGIYALKRLYYLCNLPVLKTVFHAHIQSHIAYGLCVYGGTSKTNLNKILILQKKAIRTMLNLSKEESVRQLFIEHQILTVYSLYIYQCIMFVKVNETKFIVNSNIHSYNTRNKNAIVLPKHKLELYKNKPSYAGCFFTRCMPKSIRDIQDTNKFKLVLKEYLINNAFYSLEEFIEGYV